MPMWKKQPLVKRFSGQNIPKSVLNISSKLSKFENKTIVLDLNLKKEQQTQYTLLGQQTSDGKNRHH
jgi:hypothetical protein